MLYASIKEHENYFCMRSSLVIMPRKKLPISTENGLKDSLMIGECGAGFGCSTLWIQIFKIERVENIHPQLTSKI